MSMRKLEHIGIAVNNLEEANALFAKILGTEHYKIEEVESEGVRTSFFKVGDVKIELLEATRADSPIAKFIEKRGQGLHHIAFDVESVEDRLSEMQEQGILPIRDRPSDGADDKLIAFLHPKSAGGVLIEMCQDKPAG